MSHTSANGLPEFVGTTAVASLLTGQCGDPAAIAERVMGLKQYIEDGLRAYAPYDIMVGPCCLLMEGQGYMFGTWGRQVFDSSQVIGFAGGAEESDRSLVQAYELLQRNAGPVGQDGCGGG